MTRGGNRQGAGRPKGSTKGEGMPTKVIRISSDITKEQCDNIITLKDILNHWEERTISNNGNPRYYYLKQMLDEIRVLGF